MTNHYTYNTTLNDFNASSLADLFVYPAVAVSNFWAIMLMAIFFIVSLGIYYAGDLRNKGDWLSAFAIGSWFTTVIGFIMTLVPGMIGRTPVMISLVGSIIFAILLFLTARRE